MFTKLKLSSTRRNSVCFNNVQSAKIHPQLTKENSISEGNFFAENSIFKPNEFSHSIYDNPDNPDNEINIYRKLFGCFNK